MAVTKTKTATVIGVTLAVIGASLFAALLISGLQSKKTATTTASNIASDNLYCEGNFDCDRDVDGTDAFKFKTDFGRTNCTATNPCNGDFNCDGDVDGTDAVIFNADFGRMPAKNPCPGCDGVTKCTYTNNCITGQTLCNGTCVNTNSNVMNCGSCGHECNGRQACINGACVCNEANPTICDGVNGICVDLQYNDLHCGKCNNACPTGTTCQNGDCKCIDNPDAIVCNGTCVNTKSNVMNCGSCGHECNGRQACINGACVCNEANPTICDGVNGICVDLQYNDLHCGKCNNACPTGTTCQNGVCTMY